MLPLFKEWKNPVSNLQNQKKIVNTKENHKPKFIVSSL